MNTKRGALREGCSSFSGARAAATSGRSCSAACRVFFERDLVTIVEAPDRARSNLELLRAAEPQADVIKRQVRLRGDKIEQPLLMLVHRRAAMAGAGLGLDAAGRRPALDPADRRRGTDVEQTCRLPRTVTLLDDRDDPPPQVFRVSLRHRAPPPLSSEEPNLICAPEGTPYNPSDSNQTESALVAGGKDPTRVTHGEGFGGVMERYLALRESAMKPRSFTGTARHLRQHAKPLQRL